MVLIEGLAHVSRTCSMLKTACRKRMVEFAVLWYMLRLTLNIERKGRGKREGEEGTRKGGSINQQQWGVRV